MASKEASNRSFWPKCMLLQGLTPIMFVLLSFSLKKLQNGVKESALVPDCPRDCLFVCVCRCFFVSLSACVFLYAVLSRFLS